jgi:hypothetical protein
MQFLFSFQEFPAFSAFVGFSRHASLRNKPVVVHFSPHSLHLLFSVAGSSFTPTGKSAAPAMSWRNSPS